MFIQKCNIHNSESNVFGNLLHNQHETIEMLSNGGVRRIELEGNKDGWYVSILTWVSGHVMNGHTVPGWHTSKLAAATAAVDFLKQTTDFVR
jgi:hypothetical protein